MINYIFRSKVKRLYKIENTQILVLVGMNYSPGDAQNKSF